MKPILDACCGARMFYFDKEDKRIVFQDIRELETTLCDGRKLIIKPDILGDFRKMKFADNHFKLVIFDPPHLYKVGEKSWLALKYGKLGENWKNDLKQGFNECWRVLDNGGTLLFKWNETDIKVGEMIKLFEKKPILFNKRDKTHWIVYFKEIK